MDILKVKPDDIGICGFIYYIKNDINNSFYIGQTVLSVNKRFNMHSNGNYKSIIQSAISKYGKENFTVEIIGWATSREQLDKFEIKAISYYRKYFRNYNISSGGQFTSRITEETAAKISKALKGVPKSKEHIEKVRQKHLGTKRSKETIKKIIDSKTKTMGEKIISVDISGNILYFDSINSASRYFDIIKQKIKHSMKRNTIINRNIRFFYLEDFDSSVPTEKLFYKYKLEKETEISYYFSLREIRIKFNKPEHMLYNSLKTGKFLDYNLGEV